MLNHLIRSAGCRCLSDLILNQSNFKSKRALLLNCYKLSNITVKMTTSTTAANKILNIEYIERGARHTENYRIYYANADTNVAISPWHDIPLLADPEKKIFHMVVEIPRWSNAKMEISTKDLMNPIKQDMKKGALRYVRNVYPHHGYIWNYGAIPQTWENPEVVDEETGFKGDNDPVDACEIGSKIHKRGAVIKVKVLGCYALIDEGETDWKLIVVDVNDPLSEKLNDLNDVERLFPGLLAGTREWFRIYKVPDGKPRNKFAFNDEPKGRDFALKVLEHCHEQWKDLIKREENKTGLDIRNSTITESAHKIENPKSMLTNVAPFSPGPGLSISERYEIDKWHFVNPE